VVSTTIKPGKRSPSWVRLYDMILRHLEGSCDEKKENRP